MRTRAAPLALLLLAGTLCARGADAGKRPSKSPAPLVTPTDDAAEKKARAQKLVGDGRALFDRGSFTDAVVKFEEAYRLFPVPKMLYNLGITYDATRRDDRAVCALEQFVAEVPDADVILRRDSEDRLARLRPLIGRIEVEAPAGAVLFVDGEERGTAPARTPLCAAEGKHRIVAVSSGSTPVGLDVMVRPAAVLRLALDPATNRAKLLSDSGVAAMAIATATPPAPDANSGGSDNQPAWKKGWFWGVVGVVAVGAAAGIIIGTRPVDVAAPVADFGPVMVFK